MCILPYASLYSLLKNWRFQILKLQIPLIHISKYTTQILGVILALLDDSDESVQLTAVSCLLMVKFFIYCIWLCVYFQTILIQEFTLLLFDLSDSWIFT